MKIALVNLLVTLLFSTSYFYLAYKVMKNFFEKISRPLSHASQILLSCSLLGFGIVFYNVTDISTNAFQFFALKSQISKGFTYSFLFTFLGFLSSFIFFHISRFLVKTVTMENEKAELARNNYHIAALHSTLYILFCLILSSPLASVINNLISYPKFPN